MSLVTLLLFAAAVLPLVITPGPDMLFVISQGLAGGRRAALKADLGILLGYAAHAILAAFGVAAMVAASPMIFELVRWAGGVYMGYLAICMIRSAVKPNRLTFEAGSGGAIYRRAYLSSFLNPKTLLVYLAILPNFIDPSKGVAAQATALSVVFILLCGTVYGLVGMLIAWAVQRGKFADRHRRYLDGAAGTLLGISAVRLAVDN
jgi:threonine/homoserine/homoserine lactone efflux protein